MNNAPKVGYFIAAAGVGFGAIPIALDLMTFGEVRMLWHLPVGAVLVVVGIARVLLVERCP